MRVLALGTRRKSCGAREARIYALARVARSAYICVSPRSAYICVSPRSAKLVHAAALPR